MTCIAGLIDDNIVYMGADSAGVGGYYNLVIRGDEKIFTNGPYLIGFTSSFRMGQLLRYQFVPPIPEPGEDLNKFMVTKFIDGIRNCFKDGGFAARRDEQESGGSFLVGYNGHLFEINDDYQVGVPLDNMAACGCGSQIALGALYATAGNQPYERILTSLKAAERFNAGVRGPFRILWKGNDNIKGTSIQY